MTGYVVNHPAVLATCSRCGALTFTGITGGLNTVTDVKPLDIAGEIAVLMSGKATFGLMATGHSLFLAWRSVAEIRAGRDHPVVALHQCGAGTRQHPVSAVTASPEPDDPPF